MPGTSAHWLHRDQRARHVSKGCPGTWEISSPPAQAGTVVPNERKGDRGGEKSEHRDTSMEAGEPARGTLRSKEWCRKSEPSEERWERRRAHQLSQRRSNG